jgi:hypothetical protein
MRIFRVPLHSHPVPAARSIIPGSLGLLIRLLLLNNTTEVIHRPHNVFVVPWIAQQRADYLCGEGGEGGRMKGNKQLLPAVNKSSRIQDLGVGY